MLKRPAAAKAGAAAAKAPRRAAPEAEAEVEGGKEAAVATSSPVTNLIDPFDVPLPPLKEAAKKLPEKGLTIHGGFRFGGNREVDGLGCRSYFFKMNADKKNQVRESEGCIRLQIGWGAYAHSAFASATKVGPALIPQEGETCEVVPDGTVSVQEETMIYRNIGTGSNFQYVFRCPPPPSGEEWEPPAPRPPPGAGASPVFEDASVRIWRIVDNAPQAEREAWRFDLDTVWCFTGLDPKGAPAGRDAAFRAGRTGMPWHGGGPFREYLFELKRKPDEAGK